MHAVRAANAILFFILYKNHGRGKKKRGEEGCVIYAIIKRIGQSWPERIRLERNWGREALSGTYTCLLYYTLVLNFPMVNST